MPAAPEGSAAAITFSFDNIWPAFRAVFVGKAKGTMKSAFDSLNKQNLEEFLEDLITNSDRPDQVDLLVEILREIQQAGTELPEEAPARDVRVRSDRYDIFKKYPDRVVRIGFVKGAENAKRVLPGLNSTGESVYFLRDSTLG